MVISGINLFSLFNYQGKKFYFFGDYHDNNKNIKFDKNNINTLLTNWFQYNYNHKINLNVYLEESYSTINKRDYYDHLNNNWLEINSYLFQSCFYNDLSLCPYYPYVKGYSIDVRAVNGIKISPFNLDFLDKYNKNEIKNLLYIYKYDIINAMLDVNGFLTFVNILNNIKNNLTLLKSVYARRIKKMQKYYVDDIAILFNRLDTNTQHQIKTFIFNQIEKLKLNDDYFVKLGAYTMDIYLLTNLYLSDSKENIIYAGVHHVETYNLYFSQFVEPTYISPVSQNYVVTI